MDCNSIKKLMNEMCFNEKKTNNKETNELKEDTYCHKSKIWYNEKCKKDNKNIKLETKS